ncbi:MAG: ABC transporter permease [Actinomycetota bacterium]|nr:ABC transporter permease [Actinomycetota bacterium]
MIRFALKGLLGRKVRTTLTAVAIVLGVAMVSGTFVLTDSIDQAFNTIFTDVRKGSSVVITGKPAFKLSDESANQKPTLDETVLRKVRSLPSVAAAEGGVNSDQALLIGRNGKAIVYGGAPNLGFSIANGNSPFNPLTLVQGDWPRNDEVVIDQSTAKKEGFKVADTIGVQADGPVRRLRISGIVKFGSVDTIGGATLAGFNLPTAQRLFDKPGQLDEIAVAAKPGVSDAALIKEVRAVLPRDAQVRTAAGQAHEDAAGTNTFINFLRIFLLVFAGVSLFVGSFVIANSLSITIAQRTREFATIRTIGASRRQVLGSILLESLIVGALAATIGLFLGLALAKGLVALFNLAGFTLPNSGLIFAPRTVVVSLVVGIVVTVIASMRPAFRATRVPPIAAVREGATLPESRLARFRTPGSAVLIVLGFASLLYALFAPDLGTRQLLIWMGVGALLVFIGVALLSVRFIRPLAAALGWPATRIGGAAGVLARDNARRNPQRTASTAAALMIGLALVTLVALLAAGINTTFRKAVNDLWGGADYAITAQNNFNPISTAAAEAVAKLPGVEAVGNVRAGEARAFKKNIFATAVNPATSTIFNVKWKEGSNAVLAALGDNGAFVDENYAKNHDLKVGSPVELTFANGEKERFVIKGIFEPPTGGSPFGPITVSAATFDRFNPKPRNLYSFVRMRGGQTDANLAAVTQRLKEFPNAKAQTRTEFIKNQTLFLSRILLMLYVLLALSVIVSLFGIVNTLILTVFERTRELGMLRAVGMTRRQVRRMIRHESVITALIGGFLGIVLGVVLAGLLVARIEFIEFTLPILSLVIFTLATILVGIVAAIAPARRAAKLNVLEALQYE